MKNKKQIFLIAALAIICFILFKPNSKKSEIIKDSKDINKEENITAILPDSLYLDLVDVKVIDQDNLEYSVNTNIPLPFRCSFSFDLVGLKSDDPAIGSTEFVLVDESPFIYTLNTKEEKLPSAKYLAEVNFHHKWKRKEEENKLTHQIKYSLKDSAYVNLKSNYIDVNQRIENDKKFWWVTENIYAGVNWNKKAITNELGQYEELKVTNKNPKIIKAFYFKDPNITIFISTALNEVLTWRDGKDYNL